MTEIYKHARAAEFCNLARRLVGADGKPVTNAEIARLVGVSTASVSKIFSGVQNPQPSKVDLLRRIVEERLGAPPPSPELALRDQIKFLEEHAPAEAAVARVMINAVYQKAFNSAQLSVDEARALGGASAARRLARESGQKQKAGAPSGDKPAPGGDVVEGSK